MRLRVRGWGAESAAAWAILPSCVEEAESDRGVVVAPTPARKTPRDLPPRLRLVACDGDDPTSRSYPSMTDPRWQRIKDLFALALAARPEDVAAVLAAECGDDAQLRSQVESLLRANEAFAATPAG